MRTATNLNKMISAGLGEQTKAPRSGVAVGGAMQNDVIEILIDDVDQLQDDVDQLQDDVAQLQGDVDQNSEDISRVKSQIDALGLSVVDGAINITYTV